MADTHQDFDLADVELDQNTVGPTTEELDSGDFFHAPERHWLARFSVVIFSVGLLAGTSATTAASNQWISQYTSAMCITLSAGCVIVFFSVLWWITLRELRSLSKEHDSKKRYQVTLLYFWCGLIIPIAVVSVALYFLIYQKEIL